MVRPALGLVIVACALAACSDDPISPSTIIGNSWKLTSLETAGSPPALVADPDRYTVRFQDGGQVSVQSDCNSCGGSYSLNGSALTIGPLACTKVFCGDASLDTPFTSALDRAQTATVDDDMLTIRGADVTLRLEE